MTITEANLKTLRLLKHGALPLANVNSVRAISRNAARPLIRKGLIQHSGHYCVALTDLGRAALVDAASQ